MIERLVCMFLILIAVPVSAETETLDGTTIERSGAFRPADLFSLSDAWNWWSTDGFRIGAAPDAFTHDEGRMWTLMLDGHRIAPGVFGRRNINRLPYTVSQIRSLVLSDGIDAASGSFHGGPAVSFTTKTPGRGIALRYRWGTSNETGDPGPFRYVSDRYNTETSNVDRIGPDTSVFLEGASDSWTFRAGVNNVIHASTDDALMTDAAHQSWEHRQLRTLTPSIEIGTTALPGRHRFSAFGSFSGDMTDIFSLPPEKRYRTDLLFVEPYGDAFPVETTFAYAGQNGYVPIDGGSSVRYRIGSTYGRSRAGRARGLPDALDARIVDTDGDVSFETGVYAVGAGLRQRATDAEGVHRIDTVFTVHGSRTVHVGTATRTWRAAFAGDEDRTAFRAGVTERRKLDGNTALTMSLAYRERLIAERRPTSYRAHEYAPLLASLGIPLDTEHAPDVTGAVESKVALKRAVTDVFTVTGTATYRYIETGEVAVISAVPADTGRTFDSAVAVGTVRNSHIAAASIVVKHEPSKNLRQQLTLRASECLGNGNDEFGDMYDRTPSHAGCYRLEYEPVQEFSVFGRIRHEAGVTFHGWGSEGDSPVVNTTEALTSVDFAIRKTFWRRKIRLSILAANIFNDDIRRHPLGAAFGRSLTLNVEWISGTRETEGY